MSSDLGASRLAPVTASVGGHDGSSVLMQAGQDFAILLGSARQALCRVDEHGWLALSGEAGGTIAGSGTFVRSGDHVGIYFMATRPQFQRQGIGRAVLDTAMRYYLGHNVTTFTLEATAAGVRLYEQVGFQTVAQPSVFVV